MWLVFYTIGYMLMLNALPFVDNDNDSEAEAEAVAVALTVNVYQIKNCYCFYYNKSSRQTYKQCTRA